MSDGPLDREKVKLGITPTLWWNDDFPLIDAGITFGQCVSEMALAGFEGCSIGHKYPTDTDLLRRELELRGLQVSEPWASTYFTIADMERHTLETFHQQLDLIKSLGGTDMVVRCSPTGPCSTTGSGTRSRAGSSDSGGSRTTRACASATTTTWAPG
jgi:inosose dehydratase